jgi:hypothetical protein
MTMSAAVSGNISHNDLNKTLPIHPTPLSKNCSPLKA